MKLSFERGYESFSNIVGAVHGVHSAAGYVGKVSDACNELQSNINKFKGFETGIKQLKGDVFEFRSS